MIKDRISYIEGEIKKKKFQEFRPKRQTKMCEQVETLKVSLGGPSTPLLIGCDLGQVV